MKNEELAELLCGSYMEGMKSMCMVIKETINGIESKFKILEEKMLEDFKSKLESK
jgi:hypothetical protein